MKTVQLGGSRLGSGNKMQVQMRNYERSTHNLDYIWRSTMAAGTLVPFLKKVALPGDNWDINLNADVKTLPTIGPLFGSFKFQADIFICPMRLYNAQLHMNKIGVGMDMKKVKFPLMDITSLQPNDTNISGKQLSQSSLISYLGIRSSGQKVGGATYSNIKPNAMPYLAYFDIFKQYYANKQETNAYILDNNARNAIAGIYVNSEPETIPINDPIVLSNITVLEVNIIGDQRSTFKSEYLEIIMTIGGIKKLTDIFQNVSYNNVSGYVRCTEPYEASVGNSITAVNVTEYYTTMQTVLTSFPLSNIDTMKENILKQATTNALSVSCTSITPYNIALKYDSITYKSNSYNNLVGLLVKTYQSDIFNNWLNTETISSASGINEISKVSTTTGGFTIDALQLAKKVYDVMNRIAVSGGTYEDWLTAVYDHQVMRRVENPIYMGGLSKEVVFQEVVSTAQANDNPLATLAGRGVMSQKHKGGRITIKVDEPSYIIGIVSLTPRVDYSQGNDWDINLLTMDDLHKPGLDGIGFQDLVTWKMHGIENPPSSGGITYSAGKQPAWIDYMTDYNRTYGEFANPDTQMFMTLNRRYELDTNKRIKDLTTYIDPVKYNYIFADSRRDAQNFWVQIALDIKARRKMSAKIMPNL